jgi:hypothetical protein
MPIKWLVDMRTESLLNHIGNLVLMEYLLCSKRELVHIQTTLCEPYLPTRAVYNYRHFPYPGGYLTCYPHIMTTTRAHTPAFPCSLAHVRILGVFLFKEFFLACLEINILFCKMRSSPPGGF